MSALYEATSVETYWGINSFLASISWPAHLTLPTAAETDWRRCPHWSRRTNILGIEALRERQHQRDVDRGWILSFCWGVRILAVGSQAGE